MKKWKLALAAFALAIVALAVLTQIGGTMTTLSHQIRISAPKEKVFAVLADLEQIGKYNPAVKSVKYITPEHKGVGAARECDLGSQGLVRERVTAFAEGQSISMEMYEHGWPLEFMKWTTRVDADGNETVVSQSLSYKVKFGILGTVFDKLMMRNKMDGAMNGIFHSMRNYIEKEK
jgi:uncharacterized membrane protein